MLTITIDFKLINGTDLHTLALSANEYFDSDSRFLVDNFSPTSIPKYFHAIDYLEYQPNQVQYTLLKISDESRGTSRLVSETFWNNGKNRLIQRHDITPSEKDELIIIDIETNENPEIKQILRFGAEDKLLKLEAHAIVQKNRNGSFKEKFVFPKIE